jgi:ankyrin repeat protein
MVFKVGFDVLLDFAGLDNRQRHYILVRASFEGREEMVQLLLDKGVGVNLPHHRLGNALQAASFKGH